MLSIMVQKRNDSLERHGETPMDIGRCDDNDKNNNNCNGFLKTSIFDDSDNFSGVIDEPNNNDNCSNLFNTTIFYDSDSSFPDVADSNNDNSNRCFQTTIANDSDRSLNFVEPNHFNNSNPLVNTRVTHDLDSCSSNTAVTNNDKNNYSRFFHTTIENDSDNSSSTVVESNNVNNSNDLFNTVANDSDSFSPNPVPNNDFSRFFNTTIIERENQNNYNILDESSDEDNHNRTINVFRGISRSTASEESLNETPKSFETTEQDSDEETIYCSPSCSNRQVDVDDSPIMMESFELPNDSSHNDRNSSKIIRRIKKILRDVKKQLRQNNRKIVMKLSNDCSRFQLHYTKNHNKLKRDMCCLEQILDLLQNKKKSTKRELYYEFKDLYKNQANTDRAITSICSLLNEQRGELNILSCSKGILRGPIKFINKRCNTIIDGMAQPVLISEELIMHTIRHRIKFILVVEKEASYQKLIDEDFFQLFPNCLLVTGKGYPDICTRLFLKFLIDKTKLPIFGLFDADPHGIEIYLTYAHGSASGKIEGKDAKIPSMKWIGLLPSDIKTFTIRGNNLLNLNYNDYCKLRRLKSRCIYLSEFSIINEVECMIKSRKKFDIESISSISNKYLSKMVLAPRLRNFMT